MGRPEVQRGGRRSIRHSTRCLTASEPITPRSNARSDSGQHIVGARHLQQAQDLDDEFPLAGLAHARLEQAAHPAECIQLRPCRPPAPPASRRYRKRQHLRYRSRVDSEPPCDLTSAQPFYIRRSSNLPV
jgi:hypothetical protein